MKEIEDEERVLTSDPWKTEGTLSEEGDEIKNVAVTLEERAVCTTH